MASVVERVKAGATFMDSMCVGWAEGIDRDRLNMAKCAGCIVGQTKGEFFEGCIELGLNHGQATAFGFNAAALVAFDKAVVDPNVTFAELELLGPVVDAEYDALKAAWIDEINDRLETPEREEQRVLASAPDLSLEGSPL